MAGIPNTTILAIAKNIGNNEKLLALTLELQFSYPEYENFKATNHSGGEVTSDGTTKMLFKWREKERPRDQAKVLSNALEKVGLLEVADVHLSHLLGGDETDGPADYAGNFSNPNPYRGQRRTGNVREAELNELSKYYPNANYEMFCLKLGMGSNQANNILVKYCNDYRRAVMEVLMAWKNRTGGPCRELEDALSATGAGDLILKVLHK